jgi:hypothetical protein
LVGGGGGGAPCDQIGKNVIRLKDVRDK